MSPVAESVIRRLDTARQQWWLFTLLTTAVLAAGASFGLLLLFMLADAVLVRTTSVEFSQRALLVMFVIWLGATIGLIVMVARRLTRSQRSLEATARRVEAEFPELGSDLINVVQLSSDTKNEDRAFCDAAVYHAALRIGNIHFEEAAKKESRWHRFLHCMQTPRDLGEAFGLLGLLIVLAIVSQMFLPNLGSAANRLMKPWAFVPSLGAVGEITVTPGDAEILHGTSLEITATIQNPGGEPYEGTLFTRATDQKNESPLRMTTGEQDASEKNRVFRVTLPSIVEPFRYRVEVGGSQSKIYEVKVREKPTIHEVEVTIHFPPYLGRSKETFLQKHADLEAPQYSEAELRIRPTVAIARGYLRSEGQQIDGRVEEGGMALVARMPLLKHTTFTVHLFNDAGHSDPDPRVNRVRVLPDHPPTVELLKPGRQESAAPGADVPITVRAGDDHGVGRVRLEMKVRSGDGPLGVAADQTGGASAKPAQPGDDSLPPKTLQDWTRFEGSTTVVLQHKLKLGEDLVQPGQTLMLRAVAWDKRNIGDFGLDLKPQETASGWHLVKVVAPDRNAVNAAAAPLEGIRAAIMKILETQVRARMKANLIPSKKDPAECATMAGEVRTQQVQIQKEAVALIQLIGETTKEDRLAIKRVVNQLAYGPMLEAVQQCDDLVKVKALEGYAAPVPELNATQDRIIDVLRKLLDVARQAQSEALAEMKKRAAGDLPDDTKKKIEDLKNQLDKFLEQQKKVIEASENLAKKPVEDFGEEQEQLLKQLAQAQDDFSKFMKDFHSDLSKLPEQDFANPAMAKELNEIQTELKMAEDALLKKSADIAVPLEQLGYERAEEIKTNLEKWLPDTPDREKWSQEESLSDADKEAPMAELPGELEDLIGDLMEEEEDLFDEMEDVSSSAMDSLDKGAGWDVADGPISNNSAKGATGNRLPNTSEIGGRAGEGRQGKSSGEFVGDEAVGKGGRKTPSRLTPDPYVKGQIKDHSKDSTGGATGGGKESGQGGEGLEGPQPGSPGARELERLAGKQAALRNKAEAVDLQFQVSKYHRTDMKKLLDVMAAVERDLKAGRYQNALRQRQVLAEGLGNVKQYLQGEVQTRQDTTANLPAPVQKEILGGMNDPSPAGWEEINRRYYQGLAKGGAASGDSGGAAKTSAPGTAPKTTTAPEK